MVDDPLERANLKDRHPEVFARMAAQWDAWDRTMLPEIRESFTDSFTGAQLADHFGAAKPSGAPDAGAWPK